VLLKEISASNSNLPMSNPLIVGLLDVEMVWDSGLLARSFGAVGAFSVFHDSLPACGWVLEQMDEIGTSSLSY
jgi:hypothetical protein